MTLETFGTWVVLGLLTGWLAGFVMKDGGHGRISDLLLGLAGSGRVNTFAAGGGALSAAGRVGMRVGGVAGSACGGSSKSIGAWLQKAKQARQCEPRAVPLYEARADLPPRGALLGGAP